MANWCLYSWYSGAIFFFISFFAYAPPSSAVNSTGQTEGLWAAGFASFSILIAVHHLTIFMSTKAYTTWMIGFYIFSVLCFIPISICLNEFTDASASMYMNTFSDVMTAPIYWFVVLLGTVLVCLPYYASLRYHELKKFSEFNPASQNKLASQVQPSSHSQYEAALNTLSPMKTQDAYTTSNKKLQDGTPINAIIEEDDIECETRRKLSFVCHPGKTTE